MSETNTPPVATAAPEKPKLPLLPGHILDVESGDQYIEREFTSGEGEDKQTFKYRLYLRGFDDNGLRIYVPSVIGNASADTDVIALVNRYGSSVVRDWCNAAAALAVRNKAIRGSVLYLDNGPAKDKAIAAAEATDNGVIFTADQADEWRPGSREKTSTGWFKLYNAKKIEMQKETDPEKKRERFIELQQLNTKLQEALMKEAADEAGLS